MNIIINNSRGEPIYAQIEEQIKDNIVMNKVEPNESLPSIRRLAKELRVSVITIKRAYEELERGGFIYTIPGKGSFVSFQDKNSIRESIINNIDKSFIEAIEEGKKINISFEELQLILEKLYKKNM